MVIQGCGICPLVRLGDVVDGARAIDLAGTRGYLGKCTAFKALALVVLDKHSIYGPHTYIHPARLSVVDCKKCPLLTRDPNHRDKTKTTTELLESGAPLIEAGDAIEPAGRFDLIDLVEGTK